MSNRLDGTKAHTRGSTRGKNAEDEFFPELRVRSSTPDFAKLIQPRLNLFLPRSMRGKYVFNYYGLVISSH